MYYGLWIDIIILGISRFVWFYWMNECDHRSSKPTAQCNAGPKRFHDHFYHLLFNFSFHFCIYALTHLNELYRDGGFSNATPANNNCTICLGVTLWTSRWLMIVSSWHFCKSKIDRTEIWNWLRFCSFVLFLFFFFSLLILICKIQTQNSLVDTLFDEW